MDNIITANDCSLVFDDIGRRAYINSRRGRDELKRDCAAYHCADLLEAVLSVWGETPIVPDEPLPPEPTFEEVRENKLNELAFSFNQRVAGSFTTSQGYLMQFDTSDSLKMQGAITLMEAVNASTGYITQANDVSIYDVPIETMKAVLVEMLGAYAQCHARKQEFRALINVAQTIEELNNITITWPV